MGYTLRMSAEIRDWLAELTESKPRTALAAGQALIALADAGPELGPPAVLAHTPPPDPVEALDDVYQDRLERLQLARRSAADVADLDARINAKLTELAAGQPTAQPAAEAAELSGLLPGLRRAGQQLVGASQRMQADTDAFRVRKEVLKASYTALLAQQAMAPLFARAAADLADEGVEAGQLTSTEYAQRLSAITADMERELSLQGGSGELMELRPRVPGGTGGEVLVIFAVEPAGSALLISVLEGREAVAGQHREAVAVSAQILRRVRAGQDHEATAVAFESGRLLADALFAGRADEAMAGAAALAARSRGGTLADARARLGLSLEQVAGRMGVPPERVAVIERDDPSSVHLGAIAGYVEALGGRLDVTADFGDARVALR
jgi:hypothetical protein